MRIGMLTFHPAFNYGAFLQTYSLYHVLKKMGQDVSIIDYRPDYLTRPYNLVTLPKYDSKKNILSNFYTLFGTLVVKLLNLRQSYHRRDYFNQSLNRYFQYSKKRNILSSKDLFKCESYDVYIAGSDQIWNPEITAGILDPAYFLSFANGKAKKSIYGASMKISTLPQEHLEDFKKYVQNLHYISLRECSAVSFVKEYSDAVCVLDPSLLLTNDEWSSFSVKPRIHPKKYLVSYYLGRDSSYIDKVKRIAQNSGLEIVWIHTKSVFHGIPLRNSVRPEEFVWYFKHASAVVTDSFHGTLFSVIFHIPFYAVAPYPQSVRIRDHLKRLGLESRFYLSVSDVPDTMTLIHYPDSDERLQKMRESSINFLNHIIES